MLDKIITFFLSIVTAILSIGYSPTPVTPVNPTALPQITARQGVCVMTYNLYYGGSGEKAPEKRAPLIAETIRSYAPDSFGVEECTPEWTELLAKELPEYTLVGKPRNLLFGEASPVLYNSEKYDAVDSGTFWLSSTPALVSHGWDGQFNRVCSYVVLKDKVTGFTYAHFNAHFDNKGSIARLESVAVVSKQIAKICPGIPVVFSGDLNEDENSEMYSRILECGFVDSRKAASDAENRDCSTWHGYSDRQGSPIDFIFVNSAFVDDISLYKVDLAQYNGMYPSDHHPVIAYMDLTDR